MSKKSSVKSLLSAVVLGVFILIAVGSVETLFLTELLGFKTSKEYQHSSGKFFLVYKLNEKVHLVTTYKYDENHCYHGEVEVAFHHKDLPEAWFVIKANYNHGILDGITKVVLPEDGTSKSIHYTIGKRIAESEFRHHIKGENTGIQRLSYEYPVYQAYLNGLNIDDEYIEAFVDTIETLLSKQTFENGEFDDKYDEIVESLEETRFDSIISINRSVAGMHGLELLKDFELRLALLGHYRSGGTSTFNIIASTYPHFLELLKEEEVSEAEFETFCNDLDAKCTSYGPLDTEDIWFVDSVDNYLYRALMEIYDTELPDLKTGKPYGLNAVQATLRATKKIIQPSSGETSSSEIAEMALYLIVMKFFEGDILKQAVREAYLINERVIFTPHVATRFLENSSETSVTLKSYVFETGGADVTERGLAWATHYNPTIEDNTKSSGTGTGDFTVTIEGLTDGTKYYARTYGTNSEGTAYGNCVEFVAKAPTDPVDPAGIDVNRTSVNEFTLHPNPATTSTTLGFELRSTENLVLTMLNIKGQEVYKLDLGLLPKGEQQVPIDLSQFTNGTYIFILSDGKEMITKKLVIAR